jgi:TatD DNase family protein
VLVDTHCHIHDSEFVEKYQFTQEELIERSVNLGVEKLICVGTSVKSSVEAMQFAQAHPGCSFSIALHPHEAEKLSNTELDKEFSKLSLIAQKQPNKLVAIGECGLDYFYHSDKNVLDKQEKLFRQHLDLALEYDLPIIFHIRDAFDDFFRIIDEYKGIRGVVHSFSSGIKELEGVLSRGLYVGLNGIMTFTKDKNQLQAAKNVPIDKLLIETDSPFLTPSPLRGTINEPKHVILITQFLSELRGESQAFLAKQTTENAKNLFNL